MSNILVTGGLGFIGSNFIYELIKDKNLIVNIDFETYASINKSILNFESYKNYKHYKVDIADYEKVSYIINKFSFDSIFHFAAESHVDNSINNSLLFSKTNIMGTLNLLESYKNLKIKNKLFVHISTDEVFGSIKNGKFDENSRYNPNSPYSASKASSDHLVKSYFKTYKLPVIITNCSNNYGPYQNVEKFIPTIINSLINKKNIPIYGDGKNIREWIHVEDHINGLIHLSKNGKVGESYCIGSGEEFSNIDIVKIICKIFDELTGSLHSDNLISYVEDRKGHDYRYALNSNKIIKTGWNCKKTFKNSIKNVIKWYLNNKSFLS
tara:strand:- start:9452 stop:10423 length:972 start_codon:yes stop_codon:yes gene_type:complete